MDDSQLRPLLDAPTAVGDADAVALTGVSRDAAATRALGAALGRCLPPGVLVTLDGPLGAGKTTLAQGLAAGLGVTAAVTSPTYALVRSYALPATAGDGRADGRGDDRRLVHADLYRIGSPDEARELGLDELVDAGDRVVVEWPSRAGAALDDVDVDVDVALSLAPAEAWSPEAMSNDVDAGTRTAAPVDDDGRASRTIRVVGRSAAGRAVVACLAAALAAAGGGAA